MPEKNYNVLLLLSFNVMNTLKLKTHKKKRTLYFFLASSLQSAA